ncbi:MAG: hypothetical protein E7572_03850 [Ruminococcaceae bacterium]|jgi:hypothetical protein|nr:hypothetical protein [Oscillospiraceae bacterium]
MADFAKNDWKTGDTITADQLNRMEDGIQQANTRAMTPGPKGVDGTNGTDGKDGKDAVLTVATVDAIGAVKMAAALPDAAENADAAALRTTLNGLLAALRTAGIVAAK